MKNKIITISLIASTIGLLGGYTIASFLKNDSSNLIQNQNRIQQRRNLNKGNCLADDCLTVDNLDYPVGDLSQQAKEALIEAINDEYKAHALYEKTIEKFGFVRPFSMIIRAEEQHISSLKSLFDKYGLEIPKDNWTNKVSVEKTIQQACQTGVDAEIANAKLYQDKLLPMVSDYEDIKLVFTNLMNASQEKHLVAFERCN
ncbi:MAG TPA: DUF2202 domain-containing protein [Candidatus Woesebacteria bacterium]|jgi:hypothetical protein|nr:DUF2202 domain-containing protein [Candidatus Shapirobacteria bacterium]HOR02341.1 DUF2202 domain-containing protein [Candidatus Woesebacteria bacterium]